jgi:FlaA1/EpsC-like NDP-sugar epimerase
MSFIYRISSLPRKHKAIIMMCFDGFALPACFILAIFLRVGQHTQGALNLTSGVGLLALIAVPALALPLLWFSGLYRSVLRYLDFKTVILSSAALGIAVLVVYAGARYILGATFPRSSILIFWFVSFSYLVCSRFAALVLLHKYRKLGAVAKRVAIYGAGVAGAQTAQALQASPEFVPVCFFDDAQSLAGSVVSGLKVFGSNRAAEVVSQLEVEQIVLAMPSATEGRRRDILRRLEKLHVELKVLPGITDLVEGKVAVSSLRKVDLHDLLGREPIPPKPDLFARCISSKVVLVTGAGGSIGSELCRQIASQKPARLILLEISEYNLYAIEANLQRQYPGLALTCVMANAGDRAVLDQVIGDFCVQTIYHAAAYKHVPLVEANPGAGVCNNVASTLAVAQAAMQYRVETCVLVSTDKAVRPTNIMGASKRVAELIMQAHAALPGNKPVYSMVRFGNVLGSSGSVIPKFMEQINAGGPLTVTHPEIIRYFMLIPEASQLVIQAGAMAKGGDVFVLDMGEPVKIADLARQVLNLAGRTERTPENPGGDIEIRFTGLRPGEKLFEELLIDENSEPSDHPRIMRAREPFLTLSELEPKISLLLNAAKQNDTVAILSQLQHLVPEFDHQPNGD